MSQFPLCGMRSGHERVSSLIIHGCAIADCSAAWRNAGFSTTGIWNPVKKTLWRIASISKLGRSVSGLRWSRRLSRQAAANDVCCVHQGRIKWAVILQEESSACLVPVARVPRRWPIASQAGCSSLQVYDPTLRDIPCLPPSPVSPKAKVGVIKVCIQAIVQEPDLVEHCSS